MTPLERIERAADALKVFPLPSVVLFPGAVLPLHIFEPRYRALVHEALASDRVMAMGQPLEGGHSSAGRPELKDVVCAGVITWYESLEDGRYNLLVQGVARARVLSELPSTKPFRELKVHPLPDPPLEGDADEALLRQAMLELCARLPPEVAQPLLQAASHTQGGTLADVLASAVIDDLDRRQALLEELDVKRRLVEVMMDVSDVIARLSPLKPVGPVN